MLPQVNNEKREAAIDEAGAATSAPKKKSESEIVTMEDGRKVEFAGLADAPRARRLVKDYVLNEDGSLNHIRLDFRNGVTRQITLPESLIGTFAGHGGIQKYGDEVAGLTDIDDMVLAVDELDKNIQAGKWTTRVPGDGLGGTSVLIKALLAFSGKPLETIKAFLSDKDAKYKAALRLDEKKVSSVTGKTMAQHVKEIEAEKASKSAKVDTEAALDDLDAM